MKSKWLKWVADFSLIRGHFLFVLMYNPLLLKYQVNLILKYLDNKIFTMSFAIFIGPNTDIMYGFLNRAK